MNEDLLLVNVPRNHVDGLEVDCVVDYLDGLANSREQSLSAMGKVVISFAYYDGQPTPIWENPRIRSWYQTLGSQVPHLFFFLHPGTPGHESSLNDYVLSSIDGKPMGKSRVVPQSAIVQFILTHTQALILFCEENRIPPSDAVTNHAAAINKVLKKHPSMPTDAIQ